MTTNHHQKNIIFSLCILLCFIPFVSPAIALAMGIILSLLGIKQENFTKHTSFALQSSIVLMGFGMNLTQVISTSKSGFIDTAISVTSVMLIGILLGKLLKVESKIGLLISSGTAICGGSAIAAVAPVVNAKSYQISFSLVVVFILNGIALFLFPAIGHYFKMSQVDFGTWAAIAIHDTSSVVGAAAIYGEEALKVATTIKLIRALWIIPLSLVIALLQKNNNAGKLKIPWFIGLFVVSILIAHFIPSGAATYHHFEWLGKRGMVIALFLIGSGISFQEAKKAGLRSFLLGITLWLFISIVSFLIIINT